MFTLLAFHVSRVQWFISVTCVNSPFLRVSCVNSPSNIYTVKDWNNFVNFQVCFILIPVSTTHTIDSGVGIFFLHLSANNYSDRLDQFINQTTTKAFQRTFLSLAIQLHSISITEHLSAEPICVLSLFFLPCFIFPALRQQLKYLIKGLPLLHQSIYFFYSMRVRASKHVSVSIHACVSLLINYMLEGFIYICEGVENLRVGGRIVGIFI